MKGDNILVRRTDVRAMLMDLGTGLYPGAAALTPAMGFPGTPLYRSPESWFFEVRFYSSATALYRPTAADDLYSLGVTACRLLTGEYPEFDAPTRDEHGTFHQGGVRLPGALMKSPRVDPALRTLTLRLLSLQPEERGTAAQLAQELEATFRPARPIGSGGASGSAGRHGWALLAAVGLFLLIGAGWLLHGKSPREQSAARAEAAQVGTSGLGDSATSSALEKALKDFSAEGLGKDTLPEPMPDQMRPDQKGRCPLKGQVSLNGGCWWDGIGEPEKCLELEGQLFKGTCYVPVIPSGKKRPPTSGPMKKP